MNCRRARTQMHQLLDGTLVNAHELDQHLRHCRNCQTELARLRCVHDAVARSVLSSDDEARLQRATQAVLQAVSVHDARRPNGARRRMWALAMPAAVLSVFCLGLLAGRSIWPQQVTVTQVVAKPQVVEKIVKVRVPVEVPVVTERVVVKRVPVVRTKVVYRDRLVPAAAPVQPVGPPPLEYTTEPPAPRQPVKADEVIVRLDAPRMPARSSVSNEIHAVTLAQETATDSEPSETRHNPSDGVPNGRPMAGTRITWNPTPSP